MHSKIRQAFSFQSFQQLKQKNYSFVKNRVNKLLINDSDEMSNANEAINSNGDNMTTAIKVYNGCNGNNFPVDIAHQLSTHLEKRNAGRASKFTLDNATTILDALQDGKTIQQACDIVGISRPTYLTWCRLSPEFLKAVAQAQEDRADSMVDDGFATLADVDTEGKEGMARLRKAEQLARYRLDIAKCLNNKYIEKKHNLNLNVNTTVTEADVSGWFNR